MTDAIAREIVRAAKPPQVDSSEHDAITRATVQEETIMPLVMLLLASMPGKSGAELISEIMTALTMALLVGYDLGKAAAEIEQLERLR